MNRVGIGKPDNVNKDRKLKIIDTGEWLYFNVNHILCRLWKA